MATFKDTSGQERKIELDAFILDEIRSRFGIDLADLAGEPMIAHVVRRALDLAPSIENGRMDRRERPLLHQ